MKPVIYQMLPRYWGGDEGKNIRGGSLKENCCGHFADIDADTLRYLRSLGVTHLWLTGVLRHATACSEAGCIPSHPQFVKGSAGSPYAITDYYDVNPYLALDPTQRLAEFDSLVGRIHGAGLKVLIDFVPNHVSRDNVNFGSDDDRTVHWSPNNDFFYYPGEHLKMPVPFSPVPGCDRPYDEYPARATGNNCFCSWPSQQDWYETVKLNICDFHNPTWDKLLDILLFWAGRGVDGFRCDMVELVPPEFMAWVVSRVKDQYRDILFIAEVYNMDGYGRYVHDVGFDYLYDKSGMYDILREIVYRNANEDHSVVELWQSARRLTANWQLLGNLQSNMLNFLENHDEQRLACPDFAGSPSKAWAALAVSLLFNRAAFMLYAGQEVGESGSYSEGFSGNDGRSTIFDWWCVPSLRRLRAYVHTGHGLEDEELQTLERYLSIMQYAGKKAFAEGEVYDLCYCNLSAPGFDPDRHFAFLRYDASECYLVSCNFSEAAANQTLYLPTRDENVSVEVGPFDYTIIRLA